MPAKDTNNSQFFVLFKSAPHLDHKHVVFGGLIGEEGQILKKLEAHQRVRRFVRPSSPSGSPEVEQRPVQGALLGRSGKRFVVVTRAMWFSALVARKLALFLRSVGSCRFVGRAGCGRSICHCAGGSAHDCAER